MQKISILEELDRLLDSICIDDDWGADLGNAGFKIKITNEDEDSDWHSIDISWYTNFEAEKDGLIFSCSLSGTASKEISYDRWVDTNCYVVTDYSVEEI